MENKEIEKLLDCSKCHLYYCNTCAITWSDRKLIREYIEKLESEVNKDGN